MPQGLLPHPWDGGVGSGDLVRLPPSRRALGAHEGGEGGGSSLQLVSHPDGSGLLSGRGSMNTGFPGAGKLTAGWCLGGRPLSASARSGQLCGFAEILVGRAFPLLPVSSGQLLTHAACHTSFLRGIGPGRNSEFNFELPGSWWEEGEGGMAVRGEGIGE